MTVPPTLDGASLDAVRHRGGPLQIIASAGSGKTEVVSQRIADLLADGVLPGQIVSFTFNEAAADELKTRVEDRVANRLGRGFLDHMNDCFIGTIHSYCFRLLQSQVPGYETFDVLDEHGLSAFLSIESSRIKLGELDRPLFAAIRDFRANIAVVENELIAVDQLEGAFGEITRRYYNELNLRRLLTYGQQIEHAVRALESGAVLGTIHSSLRHLVVDEYQDINPAQERLIELLASGPVELCVVGDDDQSIYQWRGADVNNILEFKQRYDAKQYPIVVNRRSRPGIISLANGISSQIPNRLPKEMQPDREPAEPEHTVWVAPTEQGESETIAEAIRNLRDQGWRYSDIAVLVRGKVAYPALLRAFERIPVTTGAAEGLFQQPLARLFGRSVAFLAGIEWSDEQYGQRLSVEIDDLLDRHEIEYGLGSGQRQELRELLENWQEEAESPTHPADLVGDFYRLLEHCGVLDWDPDEPENVARLGCLARCSRILADFESVQRRSRPDPAVPGEQIGGQDRGSFFYFRLATFVQNYAHGAYEGFEGEEDLAVDAVTLTTVHGAKGREWPIVFVPSLTAKRFPPSRMGRAGNWFVAPNLFDRARYEGSMDDERRLFYVAVTRARDWLSLSAHERVNTARSGSSPFLAGLGGEPRPDRPELPPPPSAREATGELARVNLSFSELANYLRCPYAFRLRHGLGFQPRIAPELGYGTAVHHALRRVAEHHQESGSPPSHEELDRIFEEAMFLPYASKPAHKQLKASARRLVNRYLEAYSEDLDRLWEVERPFELHLDGATVAGRADVILDREEGQTQALALVDYKTSLRRGDDYDLQLQIYASAGRREGLDVRGAYVHDLDLGDRLSVQTDQLAIEAAEERVLKAIERFRSADFTPTPSGRACGTCDMRAVCRFRSA
ncbi:MAG: ATP-dependent helicase [Chloroflexi bacterium]|nr:ATP-dependent helicase [Chloroflexota bacterium]